MGTAMALLFGAPGLLRYVVAVVAFKIVWSWLLPFLLGDALQSQRGTVQYPHVSPIIDERLIVRPPGHRRPAGPDVEMRAGHGW